MREPKSKQIAVRVPAPVDAELRALADALGIPYTVLVLEGVRRLLADLQRARAMVTERAA